MDVQHELSKNKGYIILTGIVVGAAHVLELLPEELPIVTDYTSYVYLGIIILAGFCYFKFHFSPQSSGGGYQPTVRPRNMSNPAYRADINRQYGGVPPRRPPMPQAHPGQAGAPPVVPNKDVFDTFYKD